MCLNTWQAQTGMSWLPTSYKTQRADSHYRLSARCIHIHINETEVPFLSVKHMLNLSLVSAEHQIAAVGTELYAVACGLVESALPPAAVCV